MTEYKVYIGLVDKHGNEVNQDQVTALHLAFPFDGYNVQHVDGYWKGEHEKCIVFSTLQADNQYSYKQIREFVEHAKFIADQEAVILQRIDCLSVDFI